MGDKNLFNNMIDSINMKLNKINKVLNELDEVFIHEDINESKRIKNDIKTEAKYHADMIDAIRYAPNFNIKNQLQFRFENGIYDYEDLVDLEQIRSNHSEDIEVTI